MASRYLNKAFYSLDLIKEYKDTIQSILLSSYSKVSANIKKKLLISSPNSKKSESKLSSPSKSDQSISPLSKISRKQFLAHFKEKTEESKIFAIKLMKEQKKRLKEKQEREELQQKKLDEQKIIEEKIKEQEMYEQELTKCKKLQEMQEKSIKRKNDLTYRKELIKTSNREAYSATPLFKQIEEDFFYRIEMPELERRKKELQQKRELHKPISLSEILEHAKHVQSLKQELQIRKEKEFSAKAFDEKIYHSVFNMKTKFTENVIEEKKRNKEIEIQKEIDKRLRAEKKKKYSEIVNEMFQPSIDKFKEQEMKLIKARLEIPIKYKYKLVNEEKNSDYSRSVSVQPKKWKKNTMIPEAKEKREGKKIFYLEERRKIRENENVIDKSILNWEEKIRSSRDDIEKINILKKNAEKLEKEAQRYEVRINNGKLDIGVAEHVNDLIINSIKAKLEILKN